MSPDTRERHLHPPRGELPSFLRGLRLPTTTDEACAWAEAHGAPPAALAFLEALPSAVFTSPEGLRHAFSELGASGTPDGVPRTTPMAHDGTSD